ncbi:hypothetical protein VTO42DRAFT_520 [Malbranchea cinnamomea]
MKSSTSISVLLERPSRILNPFRTWTVYALYGWILLLAYYDQVRAPDLADFRYAPLSPRFPVSERATSISVAFFLALNSSIS